MVLVLCVMIIVLSVEILILGNSFKVDVFVRMDTRIQDHLYVLYKQFVLFVRMDII